MAITSVGYAGTVTDADWRSLATKSVSNMYGVETFASWRVTAATGDRRVSIAVGTGFGLGVLDVSNSVVTLQGATVSSGSRWDLIAAHRDWASGVTSFVIVSGSATKAIPTRDTGFGGENDQPLALVRFAAGQTTPQEIVDLRCIPGDGGLIAFDALALQYLTRLGTSVRIGSVVWDRVTNGSGSPIWVSSDQTDTGWVEVTRGPGWTVPAGHVMQIRRVGALVELRGALSASTTAATVFNLCTVPLAFRPKGQMFLGGYHSGWGGGNYGEQYISPAGIVSVPSRYYTASLGVNGLMPIAAHWFIG